MRFNNILKLLFLSTALYTANAEKYAKIFNNCNRPGIAALTIDDGPHSELTPKVLDLLKEKKIKATFFINGKNYGDVEKSEVTQALMKREIAEGHDIGSHTFFHRLCFTAYEEGSLKENIERLQTAIENVIHRTPRFFRPPEGQGGFSKEYCEKIHSKYDPKTEIIRGILAGDGYRYGPDFGDYDYDIILWNADPEDWRGDGVTQTYKDALSNIDYSMDPAKADPSKDSFIVLVHDVNEYSVNNSIPRIIDHVRELGYEFVPLSECIGREPYRNVKSSSSSSEQTEKTEKTKTTEKTETTEKTATVVTNNSISRGVVDDTSSTTQANTEADNGNNDSTNVAETVEDTSREISLQNDSTIVVGNEHANTNNASYQDAQEDSSARQLSIITLSGLVATLLMTFMF